MREVVLDQILLEEIRRVTYAARTKEHDGMVKRLTDAVSNVERFITLAKKFTRISELTPEVLHTFIDKIVVHERAERYKQKSEQQIDIYFTHIGNLNEF